MLNVGPDKPCNKVSLYLSFQKFHPKVLFKSFQKRKLSHSGGRTHKKKKKKKKKKKENLLEHLRRTGVYRSCTCFVFRNLYRIGALLQGTLNY